LHPHPLWASEPPPVAPSCVAMTCSAAGPARSVAVIIGYASLPRSYGATCEHAILDKAMNIEADNTRFLMEPVFLDGLITSKRPRTTHPTLVLRTDMDPAVRNSRALDRNVAIMYMTMRRRAADARNETR
jgi:hypothetical protein